VSLGKYLDDLVGFDLSHQHFFKIVYKRFVKIIPEHLGQQVSLLCFVSWKLSFDIILAGPMIFHRYHFMQLIKDFQGFIDSWLSSFRL
jgi:hypothetical protein